METIDLLLCTTTEELITICTLDSINLILKSYTIKLRYGINFINRAKQYFKSIKLNVKITATLFPIVS
jgi:hypothetical protein